MEYINSWKNTIVFEKQLSLNLQELSGKYPPHWNSFLTFIDTLKKTGSTRLLDVGCGCGAYSELCRRHAPWVEYTGMDYSQEAIEVAKKQWPKVTFLCKNYKDLKKENKEQTGILHACSLHNVLPDGDECMDFILNLNYKYVILGNIVTTEQKSYYTTYKAYDIVDTYMFRHNRKNLLDMIKKYGYSEESITSGNASNFLLIKG